MRGRLGKVYRIWPADELREAAEEATPLESPSDVSHSLRKETRCSDAGKVSDLSCCCNTSFFQAIFLVSPPSGKEGKKFLFHAKEPIYTQKHNHFGKNGSKREAYSERE